MNCLICNLIPVVEPNTICPGCQEDVRAEIAAFYRIEVGVSDIHTSLRRDDSGEQPPFDFPAAAVPPKRPCSVLGGSIRQQAREGTSAPESEHRDSCGGGDNLDGSGTTDGRGVEAESQLSTCGPSGKVGLPPRITSELKASPASDSAFKGICRKCGGLIGEHWGECLSCGYKPAAHWSFEYAGTVAFGLIVFFIAVAFACL